jgi:steroid delta-isomerase-like uncharacterized protein
MEQALSERWTAGKNRRLVQLLCFVSSKQGEGMKEKLKTLAQHWMAELWQKGNARAVMEMHAAGFIDWAPGKRKGDREGFAAGVSDFYKAFPDFYAAVEEILIDEALGQVAIRWAGSGTHLGAYLGVAPSGKRLSFRGIEILTVSMGKISERWGEWDGMDLLRQLGIWQG